MDKRKLEKYFSAYPGIDDEILKLEEEISDLEKKKQYYSAEDDEFSKSLLQTIDVALTQSRSDLSDAYDVKTFVPKVLAIMDLKQRRIIELRFWKSKETPTKWDDVARKMNYHRVYAEKIYRRALSHIEISKIRKVVTE